MIWAVVASTIPDRSSRFGNCSCSLLIQTIFKEIRNLSVFRYDHLRKEASDYQPHDSDATVESWRAALDVEVAAYTANHYRHGVSSVFGRSGAGGQISLTVCIEDHQFQPSNFCNGRWRSQWQIAFLPGTGSVATELKGILKVQVGVVMIWFVIRMKHYLC